MNNSLNSNRKKLIAVVLISLGIVGYLLYYLDIQIIKDQLGKLSFVHLVAIVFFNILIFYIYAFRWMILIDCQLFELNVVLKKYMLSNLFNFFTPANLGGDIYRIQTFLSEKLSLSRLTVLLIFERIFSVMVFGGLLLIILTFDYLQKGPLTEKFDPMLIELNFVTLMIVAGIFLMTVALLKIKSAQLKALKVSIAKTLEDVFKQIIFTRKIIPISFLTVITIVLWSLTFHSVAIELGLVIHIYYWVFICILSEISRFLPISFQGIGIREATFVFIGNIITDQAELFFIVGSIGYICYSIALIISPITCLIHNFLDSRGKHKQN